MPNYLMYRDDLETIAPDESETEEKIITVMTDGMEMARQKYGRVGTHLPCESTCSLEG